MLENIVHLQFSNNVKISNENCKKPCDNIVNLDLRLFKENLAPTKASTSYTQ